MRPGQLKSLLAVLRAGGVSEYSRTNRGETIILRLAGPFPAAADSRPTGKRASAKAAEPFPPISSEMRKQLEELGVNPDEALEVIRHSGVGGHGDA